VNSGASSTQQSVTSVTADAVSIALDVEPDSNPWVLLATPSQMAQRPGPSAPRHGVVADRSRRPSSILIGGLEESTNPNDVRSGQPSEPTPAWLSIGGLTYVCI
jgi:hypothetical protein